MFFRVFLLLIAGLSTAEQLEREVASTCVWDQTKWWTCARNVAIDGERVVATVDGRGIAFGDQDQDLVAEGWALGAVGMSSEVAVFGGALADNNTDTLFPIRLTLRFPAFKYRRHFSTCYLMLVNFLTRLSDRSHTSRRRS